MRRSGLDKVRENLRLQQVYNVFLRYGLDFLFDRWGLVGDFRSSMQRWVWNLPYDPELVTPPVRMRLMLEELGPTYVKMGQIISSQSSVIPTDWQVELEKLQSNVPPFPSDQVREILIEELGAPPEEIYATFSPEPFAAASTAQVHRATLHDGQEVVVKVQRPNIYNQMRADIGIMQNAARVLSRRSQAVRAIDLVGMLEQFGRSVLDELDYTGEAYNGFRLAENMASVPGVHIPVIYPDLSTSRVLTMEFIRGVKISNLEAIDKAGLDRTELARTTLRAMIKQLMIDGFFHADPHPGNLLVNTQTGALTFLDTGMVGELDFQQRLNLIQVLFAVKQWDVLGMAQILRNLSTPYGDHFDEKAYYRDFKRTIGRYAYSPRVSFGQSINASLELLREHGLRLDPNLTMAVKALLQTDAVATLLFPEGGMVIEGAEMIKEMGLQEVTADKIMKLATQQLTMSAREVFKRIPTLSEATISWLNQYQKGRFEIYMDTSGVAKEVNRLTRFGRQLVIALMLVGMIIGSAIATSAMALAGPELRIGTFISQLAYGGYIVSMVIGLVIVLRLVIRWWRGDDPTKD